MIHKPEKKKKKKKRKVRRHRALVEWLKQGAICGICGRRNEKGGSDFQFHHIIPGSKKVTIGSNEFGKLMEADQILELRKCELICGECHTFIHKHFDFNSKKMSKLAIFLHKSNLSI
jgi:hypothetical protein